MWLPTHANTYYISGVQHTGTFNECLDHGINTFKYPNGAILGGLWIDGEIKKIDDYQFENGCMYNIKYCQISDRRFHNELINGLNPAGRSYMTNNYPERKIPKGCYDVVDGFYNPLTKCVYDFDNPTKILR